MCSVVKSRRFTFLVVSPRVLVHTVISRTIAPRFCRGYCLFDLFGLYHLVSLFSWVKPYQDLSWSLFQGPFQLPNLKAPIIYCISSIQRRNVSCQPLKIGLSNSSSCCSAGRSDTGRVAEYPALHGGTRLPAHNNWQLVAAEGLKIQDQSLWWLSSKGHEQVFLTEDIMGMYHQQRNWSKSHLFFSWEIVVFM